MLVLMVGEARGTGSWFDNVACVMIAPILTCSTSSVASSSSSS